MIAVLMSTYNGEAYLKEQIDSILSQSRADFTLYIRDDGSRDGTAGLIRAYQDPRIVFLPGENLGPAGSFFALLRLAQEADYLFFSDQDDVWYPDKLEQMLRVIEPYGDTPTMVFSDFAMMDAAGAVTAPSYAEFASLQVAPGQTPLNKLIAQPYVFGCASVINRSLARLVLQPPEGIEMHDCWISLTAAAVGNLIYFPRQTISHRFHDRNATGRSGQSSLSSRIRRVTGGFQAQVANTALRLHQVPLLLETYGDSLLPEPKRLLTEIARAMGRSRTALVKTLRENGVSRQKTLNTLFFYFTVLGIKGELK